MCVCVEEAHQVNSGVQLRNELHAALLAISYLDHGSAVRSLAELGGERAQADVVVRLLVVKAFHSFCLQLCYKAGKHGKSQSNNKLYKVVLFFLFFLKPKVWTSVKTLVVLVQTVRRDQLKKILVSRLFHKPQNTTAQPDQLFLYEGTNANLHT